MKKNVLLKFTLSVIMLAFSVRAIHAQITPSPDSMITSTKHWSTYKILEVPQIPTAKYTSPAIILDGKDNEATWQSIPSQSFSFTRVTGADETVKYGDPTILPTGLTATYKACFDTNFFYIFVSVNSTISSHIMDTAGCNCTDAYDYDNIELYFNTTPNMVNQWSDSSSTPTWPKLNSINPYNCNEFTTGACSVPPQNYYAPTGTQGTAEQIRFIRMDNPSGAKAMLSNANSGGYNDGYGWGFDANNYNIKFEYPLLNSVQFVSTGTAGGWNLEAKIPMWGIFPVQNIALPVENIPARDTAWWNPHRDTIIGFDIAINVANKQDLIWANNTGLGTEWRDTRLFGYAKLINRTEGIHELTSPISKCFINNNNVVAVETTSNINKINVYNVVGQSMMTFENVNNKTYQFNMSNVSSGLYFVEVTDNKGVTGVQKICKK